MQNSKLQFHPLPVLTTERLKLRLGLASDAQVISEMRSTLENAKYLRRDQAFSVEEAKKWLERMKEFSLNNISGQWLIELKSNAEVVGNICIWNVSEDRFTGEIGYELQPAYKGKGIMSEALAAIIDFARLSGLKTLEAYTHMENKASLLLLRKAGFIHAADRSDPDVPSNHIYILNLIT